MANPYQYQGNGQGFLSDYSGLAAAGSAFDAFAKSYGDAQDKSLKRQETQAQMEALKSKMAREADQSKIEALKSGYQKNASGEFEEVPMTDRQSLEHNAKFFGEGAMQDPNDPTKVVIDPNTPKVMGIKAMANQRSVGNDFKAETQARLNDAMDRREHENVLRRVSANPVVKGRLTQFQNLDNALKTITEADAVTPQQIMEFQQAVRSNLGIKGTSGVGEREETYFKTAGMNAANWKQFLTGDPAKLATDSKLLGHFKQLAQIEQSNINRQFDKALAAGSAGHDSMYGRRDDLKMDLKDYLSAQKDQMTSQESAPPQAKAEGMVPKSKGLISGMLGSLFGSSADAAPPITAPDVLSYAKRHNITPEQAQTIKLQRSGE